MPGTCDKDRSCAGDLNDLLRDSAFNTYGDPVETKLAIIFLTDEEDCSDYGSLDAFKEAELPNICYVRRDLLTETGVFANLFKSLKSRPELVSMAVIGGLFDEGDGMVASRCKLGQDGNATQACHASQGKSIQTCTDLQFDGTPSCACHDPIEGLPDTNCCTADPADRYVEVARQMPHHELNTICSESYMDTLIRIVDMINQTNRVDLSRPARDAESVVVKLSSPRWGGVWRTVPRYNEVTGLPAEGGWILMEGRRSLSLHRDWIPSPGDRVQVFFLD